MSNMNFLEKLLDGVVVEWKTLGEEFPFIRNGFVGTVTPFFTDAENGVRYLQGTNIHNGVISDNAAYYVTKEFHQKCSRTQLKADDILMVQSGHIGESAVVGEKYKGSNCHALIVMSNGGKCNSRFVNYYFQSTDGKNKLKRITTGGTVKHILASKMKQFIIPIPPLKVQAEIVRILDTFTELTAKLTTELTDRKKQYNYYRDRLLSFEKGEVEWKTLREVALDFGRGKSKHRPRNDPKLYGGNTPFIQTGDIRNASHIIETYSQTYSEIGLKQSKLWPKGTLCITIAANIAETSILGFDACFPDSVIGFVANPEKTTSGYVEYLLSSLKTKLEEMGQGSAQSNINLGTFENLKLPFPSLAEQVRIASLLDKFDTLTTDLSEGLPREIALRQKQYEYYRDLLLTFPKAEA